MFPGNQSTKAKLFAHDISLFSVAYFTTSYFDSNNNLKKIKEWSFQWKMRFNPYPSKQAEEFILTRKLQKLDYPPLFLTTVP